MKKINELDITEDEKQKLLNLLCEIDSDQELVEIDDFDSSV